MKLLINILKSIQIYCVIVLFAGFINNTSLSNAEILDNIKVGYSSVHEKIDDNKKSCIPCTYLDSSLKVIKSMINDFENLNNKHCSDSNLSSRKIYEFPKQEAKPEIRYGYGRGLGGHGRHGPPSIHPDHENYRMSRASTTRRPSRPPGYY